MSTSNEYREALQGIMDVIDYQDVHLTPAYSNAKALLARPETESKAYLHLERYQLANAYEFLGGELETDVTIARYDERTDQETGETMPEGLYLSYTDYPEEGCVFLSPEERTKPVEPAAAEKAREQYQEGDVMEFIGWLSGDIAELRKVEVPRLADSWRRFKEALPSPPAATGE